MATTRKSRRQRQRKPGRIAALELIDGCGPNGMPEAIMEAHGFTIPDMVELVRSGLAAAICERVVEDRLKVTRVRLTEAGRRLLEKAKR
jgi:DNA-binding MarR family transcriptional regulator